MHRWMCKESRKYDICAFGAEFYSAFKWNNYNWLIWSKIFGNEEFNIKHNSGDLGKNCMLSLICGTYIKTYAIYILNTHTIDR